MKYNIRHDLAQMNHPANVETVFVEIERMGSKNIVVGVIYKPQAKMLMNLMLLQMYFSLRLLKMTNLCI